MITQLRSFPTWPKAMHARRGIRQTWSVRMARLDMEAGNAATENRTLLPFPISAIYQQISDGKIPGNKLVTGIDTVEGQLGQHQRIDVLVDPRARGARAIRQVILN